MFFFLWPDNSVQNGPLIDDIVKLNYNNHQTHYQANQQDNYANIDSIIIKPGHKSTVNTDNNNNGENNEEENNVNDRKRHFYLTINDDNNHQHNQPEERNIDSKRLFNNGQPMPVYLPPAATVINVNNTKLDGSNVSTLPVVSFKCPEQFGYFADQEDCSRYFVCVFGDPLHEACTGGLYFSTELQTCDWPQNVDCAASTVDVPDDNVDDIDHHKQNNQYRLNSLKKSINVNQIEMQHAALNKTSKFIDKNLADTVDEDDQLIINNINMDKYNIDDIQRTTENGSSTPAIDFDYSSNELIMDNPDFDESIASYIDTNGAVYVQDNSDDDNTTNDDNNVSGTNILSLKPGGNVVILDSNTDDNTAQTYQLHDPTVTPNDNNEMAMPDDNINSIDQV